MCKLHCALCNQVQIAAVCSRGWLLIALVLANCASAICEPGGADCCRRGRCAMCNQVVHLPMCRLQQCAAGGGAGYNWPPGCPQAISHVRGPGQQQPAFQFRPPGCTWLHQVQCSAPTSCKSAHLVLLNTKSVQVAIHTKKLHTAHLTLKLNSCHRLQRISKRNLFRGNLEGNFWEDSGVDLHGSSLEKKYFFRLAALVSSGRCISITDLNNTGNFT